MSSHSHRLGLSLALAGASCLCGADALVPVEHGVVYNAGARAFEFSITFDRQPDFLSTDAYGRMADQVQYWLDSTNAVNAFLTAYQRIGNATPPGTQSLLSFSSIPATGNATLVRLDPAAPPLYGWPGVSVGAIPYQLTADHTLRFSITQDDLGDSDGRISWAFEIYSFGASSGPPLSSPIPEPKAAQSLGAGLMLLALVHVWGRRGARSNGRSLANACPIGPLPH